MGRGAGKPHVRRSATIPLALAALGLFVATLVPGASAASYAVKLCAQGAGHDGIAAFTDVGTVGLENVDECGGPGPGLEGIAQRAVGPAGTIAAGAARWTLNAPAGTMIHELKGSRENGQWDTNRLVWVASNGSFPFLDKVESTGTGKQVDYLVNSNLFTTFLTCQQSPCAAPAGGPGFVTMVRLRAMTATMEDLVAPTVAFDPSFGTGPVHGTIQIPFAAHDAGAGLSKAELFVDGAMRASISDANGGKCALPFKHFVPCELDLASSFTLDTTQFPVDGPHTVRVLATDASGQTGEVSASIQVHNAPSIVQRPALAGEAKPGQPLTATRGSWGGEPATFAYQWLRCPPTVRDGEEAGCAPTADATQPTYVLAPPDLGMRAVVKVTATNAFGSEVALSNPSDIVAGDAHDGGDGTAPVLSGASLSHTRFRVARTRTALAASARAPRGTVLRFSSSEAGGLTIAVSRARPGARPLATLTRTIAVGRGRLAFSGRLGAKPLRPGRYRLSVTVTDAAGNTSRASRLPFAILAG